MGGGERAKLLAQSRLADGANLVDGAFSVTLGDAPFHAGAPRGVELACKWADCDGLESLIQNVEAHDDDGPGLGHLGALGWVAMRPSDFVALHFFGVRFVLAG